MNNSIYVGDKCVGFRCFNCGGVYQSMWGSTCNKCRNENDKHEALIAEIKMLRETIAKDTKNKNQINSI